MIALDHETSVHGGKRSTLGSIQSIDKIVT
jgi:hypothetical protein